MPDDDLGPQLVELIDAAAEPVTLDEVRARNVPPSRAGGRVVALIAVGAVIVIALGIAAAITRDHTTNPRPTPATVPTTSTSAPPSGDPVDDLPKLPTSTIHTFPLPADLEASHAVSALGSLWVTGYRSSCEATCPSLYRLDPADGTVDGIEGSTLDGLGVAYGDGSLFALSDRPDGSPYEVTRVDIPSARARYTVDVPDTHVYGNTNPIGRIAYGFGSVWVFDGRQSIVRLDASTGREAARIAMPLASNGLAVNPSGVWSIPFGDTDLVRIDPDTNQASIVTRFPVGFAQSIAADESWVWTTHAANALDLARVDAGDPSKVASTHIPTADVATGDGGVWFLGWIPGDKTDSPRNHPGLIGQVDPKTLAVTGVTELPIGTVDETQLAVGDGAAWVVDSTAHRAWRIDGTR